MRTYMKIKWHFRMSIYKIVYDTILHDSHAECFVRKAIMMLVSWKLDQQTQLLLVQNIKANDCTYLIKCLLIQTLMQGYYIIKYSAQF